MQVEIATVPADLAGLVSRFGKPEIILAEGMTSLIWFCADVGSEPDADGAILVRADGADAFGSCARQVDELLETLARDDRRPWFIVVTRCAADDPGRLDLQRTQELIVMDKLRWVAVWNPDSLSAVIEPGEIFAYGDEREDHHWLDRDDVGEVLVLGSTATPGKECRDARELL